MAEKLSWYIANFYYMVEEECRCSLCDNCRIGNIFCCGATAEKHTLEYQENVEKLMNALEIPNEIVVTKANLTSGKDALKEKCKFAGEKKVTMYAENLETGNIFEYEGEIYLRTHSLLYDDAIAAINLKTSYEVMFTPHCVVNLLSHNSHGLSKSCFKS